MLIGDIGQAALRLLFVAVLLAIGVHSAAIRTKSARWRRLSQGAAAVQFGLAAVASAALVYLLVTLNFHYSYVVDYTAVGLSLVYRIAAFWGGNAGSLLLWALVLSLYAMIVASSRHEDSDRMLPIVSLLMSCILAFYVIVLNTGANPFTQLPHAAASGNSLNPLLQNPGMTVHPVNVYLGYIGFSVPFAYAITGLLLRKTDATWLRVTRRWTLISWLFLGVGIVYGAHWSYEELGWGGYWAWDPIENAALLPWLSATAFLHSAIVQERRGMLKGWNILLITFTFLLTLLGSFLTRSGVLWSIHAFTNGPLGTYFLVFFVICTVFSAVVIVMRWHTLKPERRIEAVVSKESGFLLNNVLFLGSAFAILWGTLFPILSEALTGRRMMVSGPFYNAVNLPLAVCIILLMAIGPVIAWRRASVQSIVKTLVVPFVVAVVAGLAVAFLLKLHYGQSSILGTLSFIAAIFVMITIVREFLGAVGTRVALTGESWWVSFGRLVSRNRRRYGGYVVHFAIALMAAGIAGSGAYHQDLEVQLAPGQSQTIAGYQLTYAGMGVSAAQGGRQMYGNLVVQRGGQVLGVLRPSATFFTDGQSPTTNVALYSRPLSDLYVVMLGTGSNGDAVFDLHVNPLVQFIWWGGYLFILGTLVSLWPEAGWRRQRAAAASPVETVYQELAELEYDYRMGKLEPDAYQQTRQALEARAAALESYEAAMRQRLEAEVQEAFAERASRPQLGGGEA
ncbi:heme lyase CcmF/NrfE family subunit [Alicyclobacillus cycloheptanicus]|uniref:Cytochrome c-type biogenesis protein CcmF n=1 Tax=Alicyclobacillus cycloheptanicus TaxID=1457 RepID=A0ABT9XDL4_9BACL|nr:heme lyase CcmF/NrfE family subunit [Alicyclobacillus cycloheptanicus]MDQ0188394.1 cytochrome c-type biogenesis protein CcmF [Alicyclobacillus cycloheptanicus]WDM01100.1 heme lyase CcmF/NrfE family subunit [Alicyclobacillus cycloheptanicus]